jgi:hypothetical protein
MRAQEINNKKNTANNVKVVSAMAKPGRLLVPPRQERSELAGSYARPKEK